MKHAAWALLLAASLGSAEEPGDFRPAETNVWGAPYPRVDGTGRVEVRIKAPEATKVRLNFWSGPKVDMVTQAESKYARAKILGQVLRNMFLSDIGFRAKLRSTDFFCRCRIPERQSLERTTTRKFTLLPSVAKTLFAFQTGQSLAIRH